MNRKMKNIIVIVGIAVMLILTYFTMNYAGSNLDNSNNKNVFNNENVPGNRDIPNGEIPGAEMPNGDVPNGNIPNDRKNPFENQISEQLGSNNIENNELTIGYYVIFGLEGLIISILVVYLLLSNFNKKTTKETFKNTDRIIIYTLSVIILMSIITSIDVTITDKYFINNNVRTISTEGNSDEEKTDDIDEGTTLNKNNIVLDDYETNATIKEGGEYTLTGSLSNSVIIDSTEAVTLNLNNVDINSTTSGAIINKNNVQLTINLIDNTTNVLKDGGSSSFDSCIYSVGELIIDGEGSLEVYGKQTEGEGIATESNSLTINNGNIYIESNDDGLNAGGDGGIITINNGSVYISANGDGIDSNKNLVINGGTVYSMGSSVGGDAGIDTDDGFTINGGLVIALGSDMLETPLTSSEQYSICFTLEDVIQENTLITLMNENDELIVSFKADENFKTLIISSDKLKQGKYYLYKDGKNSGTLVNSIYYDGQYTKGQSITISNNNVFTIYNKITEISKIN